MGVSSKAAPHQYGQNVGKMFVVVEHARKNSGVSEGEAKTRKMTTAGLYGGPK